MIYFDNAATSFPKPPGVLTAMHSAMLHYGANPGRGGHDMSIRTAQAVYQVRESAANLFGMTNPDNVIFTTNCTHSLNTVIQGVLNPGDHVILSDLEHNSVTRPVYRLSRQGVTFDVAQTVPGDDSQTLAAFAKLIRGNTRLIICTHGSNAFGVRLPVRQLAEMARRAGVLMLVDAAQTAGVLDLSAVEDGFDYLCAPGHKGLYGPSGTGLMVINSTVMPRPLMQGGTGSFSYEYEQPDFCPDCYESGTVNTVGIIGLGAGLAYVAARTPKKIYACEMGLVVCIYDALRRNSKVKLYTPPPRLGESLPVISFNIKGLTGEQTAAKLNELGFALRGGLHCSPLAHQKYGTLEEGTARISVGSFNTPREAEMLCTAIKKL